MSNVIELNIAEIDTVVGGAGAIQTAMVNQTSTATAFARPIAPTTASFSVSGSSLDLNAMLARFEVKR